MSAALIVDAVRIPRARSGSDGAYAGLRPVELVAPLFRALEERNDLASETVDDVLLGCTTQTGEQGANLGKIAAAFAGWSDRVSGATVNRFCCSGLSAINLAAAKIGAGAETVVAAGGVEHLSRVPLFADKGAWFADPKVAERTRFMHMGLSADLLAMQAGIDRQALDAYARRSHRRAHAAITDGRFDRSLVPLSDADGQAVLAQDNAVRPETSAAQLAALAPAFADQVAFGQPMVDLAYPGSTLEAVHTVASAPALVDGASLLLLASEAACEERGWRPRARVSTFANAADEPVRMLTGHIEAVRKLLSRTGLAASDIDLWEVNESFAASILNFQQALSIDDDRFNLNGGAIALGHPLGATGGVLVATLLDELERRELQRGIVAICAGAGIGEATLIERV